MAVVLSLPAQAATDSLDQAQTLIVSSQPLATMAQTFTAGVTGQLDRVSLASDTPFQSYAKLTVTIQSVTATGAPSGTVLGSSPFQGSLTCCRQFHDFAFAPTVHVTAGTKYAIVVQRTVGLFTWYDSWLFNAYLGGQLYVYCSGCGWLTGSNFGMDFAFKTWVAVNTNKAPLVAADNPAVSVFEGTAPANTGTYSDADGRTVTITASTGTITKTGTSSGTWAWTQPPSDEPSPGQPITVTADDGNGLTTATAFNIAVKGVAPTATIASATFTAAPSHLSASTLSTSVPSSIPEGTKVTLSGTASSPAAADNAAGFTYGWTVTKNGNSFGGGSGPTVSFSVDDEGTFVATLQATDDGGMTGATSVTIAGGEVVPTAHITLVQPQLSLVLTANESVSFAGAFSDPGTLDTHTETWTFGDGASASGLSATHSYSAAGTYTVTFAVEDDDHARGTASTTLTVQTPQQALSSISGYVQNIKTLNAGQKNSLIAKLNAAGASAARGDTNAANNQLNAFLNELQADLSTGKISTADAVTLRSAVHAVQAALGTYNRFLEWWPLQA